jgi:hypothetical protein
MTEDPGPYHVATLRARLVRLNRLRDQYRGDINPLGERLLSRAYIATIEDLAAASALYDRRKVADDAGLP